MSNSDIIKFIEQNASMTSTEIIDKVVSGEIELDCSVREFIQLIAALGNSTKQE